MKLIFDTETYARLCCKEILIASKITVLPSETLSQTLESADFGRPFVKRFALSYRTVVCPLCPVCPVCNVGVYCGQTVGWIKMPLGMQVGVGLGPGHIVLDGHPAPPWKGAQQPPTSRPVSIVAKRSPMSATAELLSALSPQHVDHRGCGQLSSTVVSVTLSVHRCLQHVDRRAVRRERVVEFIGSASNVVQVVEQLSEEQQIHRDLLTMRRDDRAREIENLRRDVERQQQQLSNYERTVDQLRTVVADLLSHQTPTNSTLLHSRTTAGPVLPTGMFVRLGTHYPCSRAVNTGVQHGCHFGHREHGP